MPYAQLSRQGQILEQQPIHLAEGQQSVVVVFGACGAVEVFRDRLTQVADYEARIVPLPEETKLAPTVRYNDQICGNPPLSCDPAIPPAASGTMGVPRIEGYQITGELGHGGMGAVWRAVQLSTHRAVAVKVLGGAAFGSKKARARFEREVELCAKLDHPHIARVYDSGVHYGTYFYAMELIEGVHLDAFAREHALKPRQLIALVETIARAVHYAHQRGVIHRDLKPSNILVTSDGRPYILDFGLAKPTVRSSDMMTVTLDGAVAGTLAYSSPEQAAGQIDRVDTRTDVYSLGVILFQLLTGQLPHEITDNTYESQRRIIEQEVRRPRQFNPALDRDLETLLLKALAKDPEQRYNSAAALADDIQHYLRGEPLTGKPLTAGYFLDKWLRKHWQGVALAAAIVLVLVSMAVFSYVRVATERNIARENAAAANRALYLNRIAVARFELDRGNTSGALSSLAACPEDLRRWEWRRLRYLADQSVLTFQPSQAFVTDLAVGDNGQVVTLDSQGMVSVWDTRINKLLRSFDIAQAFPGNKITVLSNNGRFAALATSQRLTVLATDHATVLCSISLPDALPDRIAVSDDGKYVADGTKTELTVWNAATEKPQLHSARNGAADTLEFGPSNRLAFIRGEAVECWDVAGARRLWMAPHPQTASPTTLQRLTWSRDGRFLAVYSQNATIEIRDTQTGNKVQELVDHAGRVLAFDTTGRQLAVGRMNGDIVLYALADSRKLCSFRGPNAPILRLAFAPDGRRLFSVGEDITIRVWDLQRTAEGLTAWPLAENQVVLSAVPSANGAGLALLHGDGSVEYRRLAGPGTDQPQRWGAAFVALALAPGGDRLVTASHAGKVCIWDPRTGREIKTLAGFPPAAAVAAVAWSLDGRFIAAADAHGHTATVWDVSSGQRIAELPGGGAVAFVPQTGWLASVTPQDGRIGLFQPGSWHALKQIPGPAIAKSSLVFSGNGRCLATLEEGGRVYIRDILNNQVLATITPNDGFPVNSVALNNSGDRLLTSGPSAKLWDVSSAGLILTMPKEDAENVQSCVFIAHDEGIVTVDGRRMVLWKTQ